MLAQRRQNRGFEAVAFDDGKIYAFVQSPLRNPATLSNSALNGLRNVRVVEFNPATQPPKQFIYVMDNPDLGGDRTPARTRSATPLRSATASSSWWSATTTAAAGRRSGRDREEDLPVQSHRRHGRVDA